MITTKTHPDLVNLKAGDIVMSLITTDPLSKNCQPLIKGNFYRVSMVAQSQDSDDLYISVYHPMSVITIHYCNNECNCISIGNYRPFARAQHFISSRYSTCFVSKYDVKDRIRELENENEFELCSKLKNAIELNLFNDNATIEIQHLKLQDKVKPNINTFQKEQESKPESVLTKNVPENFVEDLLEKLSIPKTYAYLSNNGTIERFLIFDYQKTTGIFHLVNTKNGLLAQAKIGSILKFSNE